MPVTEIHLHQEDLKNHNENEPSDINASYDELNISQSNHTISTTPDKSDSGISSATHKDQVHTETHSQSPTPSTNEIIPIQDEEEEDFIIEDDSSMIDSSSKLELGSSLNSNLKTESNSNTDTNRIQNKQRLINQHSVSTSNTGTYSNSQLRETPSIKIISRNTDNDNIVNIINKTKLNFNPLKYIDFKQIDKSLPKIPTITNPYLRPGAIFFGEQQSGILKYHIKVEFKHIDLANSLITGFLQISGLTDNNPEITTCFKGEIINNPLNRYEWGNNSINKYNKDIIKKYSFLTEHGNWGSSIENDLEHWKKLTGSFGLNNEQLKQKLSKIQSGKQDNQFLYMRWKEEFLLPDSRIKQISGASFEGFYYIVLNIGGGSNHNENSYQNKNNSLFNSSIIPGSISGLYYHAASDKFQSLGLKYVEDKGISNVFEFA